MSIYKNDLYGNAFHFIQYITTWPHFPQLLHTVSDDEERLGSPSKSLPLVLLATDSGDGLEKRLFCVQRLHRRQDSVVLGQSSEQRSQAGSLRL